MNQPGRRRSSYSRAVPEPAPVNVWDYERLAAERLEPGVHGYFAGGAGDERTLRDNVAAFTRGRCTRVCWSTSAR